MSWSEFAEQLWPGVVATAVYTVIGLIFFALSFWVIEWLTPFSLAKEIQKEKNVAVGIILGALFIAIALIIAAAAQG